MSKILFAALLTLSCMASAAEKEKATEKKREPSQARRSYKCQVASDSFDANDRIGLCSGGVTATTSRGEVLACCPEGGGDSGGGAGGGGNSNAGGR
jgi:hypothetical protein